jgi:tricorn protease-like protein
MTSLRFDLRRFFLAAFFVVITSVGMCGVGRAAGLLLRNPSLSKDKIAFLYADDIWTVARSGGEAERLTSVGAVTEGPTFLRMARRLRTPRESMARSMCTW